MADLAARGQLRLLLAAGWRSFQRRGRRTPGLSAVVAVGAVVFLVVVAALAVVGSAWVQGLAAGGRTDAAAGAVHLVYLGAFLGLATAPLFGSGPDALVDLGRVATLPVAPRTARAAATLGLCASPTFVASAALVAAVTLGFGRSPGGPLVAVGAACAVLAAGLLTGQVLHGRFVGALRGRPWRDAAALLAALAGASVFLLFEALLHGEGGSTALEDALAGLASRRQVLLALPSAWGAQAVTGSTALDLIPAAALLALVIWLWGAAERGARRALEGGRPRSGTSRARAPSRPFLPWLWGARTAVLVRKDLAVLRREPAVRLLLLQQGAPALLAVALIAWNADPATAAHGLVAYPLVLAEMGVFLNLLGIEGGGTLHALRTPVGRVRYVVAKQVACLLVFGAANAGVVGSVAAVAGAPPGSVAAAMAEALCATAAALGAGAVGSVLGPMRVASAGHGSAIRRAAPGRGVLGTVRAWGGVALVGLVLVPLAAWLHHPALARAAGRTETAGWSLATGAAAWGLAACAMASGAWLAGRHLHRQEERVAAGLGPAAE